jgi:hypothetical protein
MFVHLFIFRTRVGAMPRRRFGKEERFPFSNRHIMHYRQRPANQTPDEHWAFSVAMTSDNNNDE